MDLLTLVYYAAICGLLSLFAPLLGSRPIRFGVGIGVGAVAALVLPVVAGLFGGY